MHLIKANDELAWEARKLLDDMAAKEPKGDEGEQLLRAFRDEAEAAEAWMGRFSSSRTTS